MKMSRIVMPSIALTLSCAHAPLTPTRQEPERSMADAGTTAEAPWYGDLHALAEQAAHVRGLVLTQPFEVVPLDDQAFFEAYAVAANDENARFLLSELVASLEALSFEEFHHELFDALFGERARGVREEQLIAFYQFPLDRLVVRRVLPPVLVAAGEETRRLVLAHEVGHVLQDQLGVTAIKPATLDEAIALRSTLEGDANLTATLLDGARKGLSPARAVERGRLTLGALTPQQLVEFGGFSPKLVSAPPVLRELYLFPYFRGQRFVADLYAAGGLDLVKAMLARPPRTTDSVFVPQRWLDGGGRRISLGPGARSLGALFVRALVEQCGQKRSDLAPQELASWVERSLVDDSFRRTGDSLVWVTTWAKPEPLSMPGFPAPRGQKGSLNREAHLVSKRAEQVMAGLAECLGAPPGDVTTAAEGWTVGLAVRAPGSARRIAKTRPQPPAPPPIGHHVVPATRLELAFRNAGQGELKDGRWVHARLGLSMAWPDTSVLLDNPASALTVASKDGAMIFGSYLDEPRSDRGDDGYLNAAMGSFFKAAGVGPKDVSLGLRHVWNNVEVDGVASAETTASFEGGIEVRARTTALCHGKGAFHVVAIALRPESRGTVDRWLGTLRGPADPALCEEP